MSTVKESWKRLKWKRFWNLLPLSKRYSLYLLNNGFARKGFGKLKLINVGVVKTSLKVGILSISQIEPETKWSSYEQFEVILIERGGTNR